MDQKKKNIVIVVVLLGIGGVIGISLLPSQAPSVIELEILPHSPDKSKEPLFQIHTETAAGWQAWNKRLNESLKEYRESPAREQRVACTHDTKISGDENKVCDVPLDNYHPCAGTSNYESTHICIFFRLNKIINWTPDAFNNKIGLPTNMPEDLKMHIAGVGNTSIANTVWLTCEGDTPADKEFIGPIMYMPQRGFPTYYYPYTNKQGYLSPMVAVWFEKPSTSILMNVVCTAWAKNIKNDAEGGQGTARFSLLIEK